MTQEQKELLLKDLCARLPYGVKVKIKHYDDAWKLHAIYTNGVGYATRDTGYPIETFFEDCKPYLFPLSSMTDKQKEELDNMFNQENDVYEKIKTNNFEFDFYRKSMFDFLNKHHFDYHGLIPIGGAIDATGLNIY